MLNEQEIVALLDGSIPPEERARLGKLLENDPAARAQVREQSRMDNILRVTLGDATAHERVKQSVLAVVRGESEEAIKQQVLHDTTFSRRSSRGNESPNKSESSQSLLTSAATRLVASFRHPAWAFGFAAICICLALGVWLAFRENRTQPAPLASAIEMPSRVDFPAGTAYYPNHPAADMVQMFRDAGSFVPKGGDGLRVSEAGSGTVAFADGTTLHLEPGTEVRFQPISNLPRNGGKQLKLIAGALSAEVAKQPEGLPLLIETPHALVTVVGTEFDLAVSTNQTQLEVGRGLVNFAPAQGTQTVSVAEGEMAVAAPNAALRFGALARNPYLWPFSSASPWNRPLGSGAKFVPVPGKPFLADGPLTNAMRGRRPMMGAVSDPLRNIWVNGQRRADVRLADSSLPRAGVRDSIVLLQRARRYALELRGVSVRPDGDLEAEDIERTDLAGPGAGLSAVAARPFGLSSLGGLIRAGEFERGIPHALACRLKRERLGGRRDFATPGTVWPASGGDEPSSEIFLSVGTLLAIPPEVDIRKIVGESGPGYELARAMQDYGVYVTGFLDGPFVLLTGEARLQPEEQDALLNKLVPLLQVVANNTEQSPSGSGVPRRASAPAFPGESSVRPASR